MRSRYRILKMPYRRKQLEEELARIEEEKEQQRVKIRRSDKEAFTKVRVYENR